MDLLLSVDLAACQELDASLGGLMTDCSGASPDLKPLGQQLPKATQCFVRTELHGLAPNLCLGDLGTVLCFQQQYDNEA